MEKDAYILVFQMYVYLPWYYYFVTIIIINIIIKNLNILNIDVSPAGNQHQVNN